jgi:hypothetical protein
MSAVPDSIRWNSSFFLMASETASWKRRERLNDERHSSIFAERLSFTVKVIFFAMPCLPLSYVYPERHV